jgi:hypothetical protein
MITKCGSDWEPTQEMMQGWAKTCPDINIQGELDRMTMWCQANKAKRKTIGGMFKFANNWLNGEQSKAARAKASGQKKKNSMRAQGIDANLTDITWLPDEDKHMMRSFYLQKVGFYHYDGKFYEQ